MTRLNQKINIFFIPEILDDYIYRDVVRLPHWVRLERDITE